MSNEEVQIGGGDEDYEVVPVGPIRKLERRIDEIQEQQTQSGNSELVSDVIDIMKSNQKIVNDMTESTHELKNSVEDLTHKMDDVIDNMNSFMDLLEEASEMDMEGEVVGDIERQLAEAMGDKLEKVSKDIEESNQEVVDRLEQLNDNMQQVQQRPQPAQNQQQASTPQTVSRDNSPSRGLDTGGDDRMKRLKEKFGNIKDE